jgi:hypothetical protein
MAKASRMDAPLRNLQYAEGVSRDDISSPAELSRDLDSQRELPAGDIPGNPLINRSAESVGRTVGSAVSAVRHLPRRIDQARSQFRSAARERSARASAVVLEMMDTAEQRAERLREATESAISDWAHTARSAGSQVGNQTAEAWDELRRMARARLDYAGRRAVAQWNYAQRTVSQWQQENPLRFVAVVAGTAFVIGAGLRIWRSSRD